MATLGDTSGHSFMGFAGAVMPGAISGITPHNWVADENGRYQTVTDLGFEWHGLYQKMLSGDLAGMTAIQHLEGNAEAIFENTGLHKLDGAIQMRDRMDLQREFDAMAGALLEAKIDASMPLSVTSYLNMEHVLQGDGVMEELAVQGHGLNNKPNERYDGYTNDIQNVVDNKTLYIGTGLDHNQKAIAAFMDDVVLGHSPFPTVFINGHLIQLNQNGAVEDRIGTAVRAFDEAAFTKVYQSTDFSMTKATDPTPMPKPPLAPAPVHVPPSGFQYAYDGNLIPTTLTVETPHTWIAGADGLYHTATDLQTEWRSDYTQMLAGHGDQLTAVQRMEGNAEAVFANTNLNKLDANTQHRDREDLQREFDAISGATAINAQMLGIDMKAQFTQVSYLALEHTMQSNTQLEELGLQGHGLNKPPSAKYNGYTQDIQNVVDAKTKFVGGGLDNGENAIAAFMDDVILGHTPFAPVEINGHLEQLNQNGAREDVLAKAVAGMNEGAFSRVFTANNFKR
jgi:hypothetical protein